MYFDGKGKIWDPLTRFFGKREVADMDEQVGILDDANRL
jgi:hypothetical protein